MLRPRDPADGKLLRGHNLGVNITTLAFSPDGKILTGDSDPGEDGREKNEPILREKGAFAP